LKLNEKIVDINVQIQLSSMFGRPACVSCIE